MIEKLSAFHDKEQEKEICLKQVQYWLQNKLKPKTAEDIAHEIFNPIRSIKKTKFILEDYQSFPKKLGLPIWISNLLFTFNHHNSTDFAGFGVNYEESFYPKFISSCMVGMDYTLMFHQWEIMLLKEFIPKSQREKKYILDLINLHEKALKALPIQKEEWHTLGKELEVLCNTIDGLTEESEDFGQKEIMWNSARVAILSIQEIINPNEFWISSSEALVDAIWEQYKHTKEMPMSENEKDFKTKVWSELMDGLIQMMEEWNQNT